MILSTKKTRGVVYTPVEIVRNILDLSGYRGARILRKRVMENSCGDGAFLCEIVERYCREAIASGYSTARIKRDLERCVCGLEIDPDAMRRCVLKANAVAERFGITDVAWNFVCCDALQTDRFDGQMDFVVGNPPYVRVHHFGETSDLVKRFSFAQEGMTDLYIAFYEIGLRMLAPGGVLGYIAPSSFFTSVAGAKMRECFVRDRLLSKVVDLKHFQAFEDATTYAAIVVLQNDLAVDGVDYFVYDAETMAPRFVERLNSNEYCVDGKFYFANRRELAFLTDILTNIGKSGASVKNGFATLCDTVFVADSFPFQSKRVIPVVKASKGVFQKIVFPYDARGVPISEEELKTDVELHRYLLAAKPRLLKRSVEKPQSASWFAYGRSQGIKDVYKDKLALNQLIRTRDDVKTVLARSGVGVYGGLYATSASIPLERIAAALHTEEFALYASLLGKYKSGGYFTFSSRDVEKYLDYQFPLVKRTASQRTVPDV